LEQAQPVPVAEAGPTLQAPETVDPLDEFGSSTRPGVPARVSEYFLPNNLTLTQAYKAADVALPDEAMSLGLLYRPVLFAQANVRILQRKYNLDYETSIAAMVVEPDRRGLVRWEEYPCPPVDPRALDSQPDPRARFASLEAPLNDHRTLSSLESDFQDWIYRTGRVNVRANETLKIYAGPDISTGEFRKMCADAAQSEREDEAAKLTDSFDKKIARLEDRLNREERELREDESELSQRKMEELGTHAENVLSLFRGRSRRLSTSLSKRRMTEKAKADVEESLDTIEDLEEQIQDLEDEKDLALQEVERKWSEIIEQDTEIPVTPYKKDILIDLFGVAWMPYHIIRSGSRLSELPGYGSG
jgi:hypothetical protein